MKKFYDQTVRDLKREVNKKVLKVPGIEQKVLEATSNEPWGPHGTLLADIAEATRNYHEYQMIMVILWKRISDTGKNWRHVYKGLTVLEYLVANGSERVIDDIREHAYQISTLSNFQYIDSSGRDQGNNVRRKSQTLVSLVNDKERIVEVRQKAAVNREKFHPAGGMHRPGSYSGSGGYGDRYGDDRYSSRDENRYNYGYDDKYGRGGDFYSRDGERYEERYGRDSYRDDDYRGRSRSVDFQYGTRSRSSDRDRAFEDDDQYSSWGLDRKFSEQNLEGKCSEQSPGAPPSYEEAVSESRSPVRSERDGDAPVSSAPQASSPPIQSTPVQETSAAASQELGTYDEFDPRGSFSAPNISTDAGPRTAEFAAPTTSSHSEMDLIGSLADPFSADVMALVPATSGTGSEADTHANSVTAPTYTTTISSNDMNQPFEDPFGDGPFKAIPSSETITGSNESRVPPSAGTQFSSQELSAPQQDMDILAGILPPSESSSVVASQAALSASAGETGLQAANIFGNAPPQLGPTGPFTSSTPQAQTLPAQQFDSGGFHSFGRPDMAVGLQSNAIVPFGQVAQSSAAPVPSAQMATHQYGASVQASGVKFLSSQGAANQISQMVSQTPAGSGVPNSSNLGNMFPQTGASFPVTSQPNIPSSSMKPVVSQPSKDKFETKSTVWSDTLSRGLVNLNISGSKVNPLSDIGIDFDALNRKEKRMEKPSTTLVTSTITMGKAMGSGSGMGRAGAGAGALRPAPNSMVNPGMGMGGRPGVGMGMGGGPGIGMGMGTGGGPGVGMGMGNRGGYGGMGQQQMGMGMGPNMGVNSGMGMGMGSGQGSQMQRPTGLPPGANIPGGYNPMMGRGGYNQQPHGSGY